MQKALIYEAIFIVNRGIDDAVSALERLKNNREAQDAGLSPAFLDQKLIEFEMHRASLNGYFTNHLDSAEEAHSCQLHKNYKQYRRKDLDEVQVYQDLELLEQRRWMEGKGPRVRFSPKKPLDCWGSNFIARIRSRWDALLSFATCHWRLSWISPRSTVSPRCDTALKTWKKNASPRTVLKRDCRIRFVAASD